MTRVDYENRYGFDAIWYAAGDLAATLRGASWYHRTSFEEVKTDTSWRQSLVVWGDTERPDELPHEFCGWLVRYNRVSREHPCPFGSVKAVEGKQ